MLSAFMSPGRQPPSTPPHSSSTNNPPNSSNPPNPQRSTSSSNIHSLLSPVTAPPANTSSKYTADEHETKKRKSLFMDADEPRRSRSPSKAPRTPERSGGERENAARSAGAGAPNSNAHASTSSGASGSSPRVSAPTSRTALGHLLNDEDRPPLSKGASLDPDPDADAVDADVLMHEETGDERSRAGEGEDEEDDGPDAEAGEGDEEDDGGDSEDDDDDEDDDDEDSGDESDDSDGSDIIEITGAAEGKQDAAVHVKTEPGATDTAGAAGTSDGAGAAAATEVVNQLQPKKKKAKRARRESMDEDLPPPPPPMPTIRIEVQFGAPGETLDFNFREAAHEAGYAVVNPYGDDYLQTEEPPTAVETAVDTPSGTPADGLPPRAPLSLMDMVHGDLDPAEMERMAAALEAKYEEPKKKTKKRRVIDYDLNDPFIDDSDLKIDAPTHVARPKKEGFFVHQGVLELMEESPHKLKSRSKPKTSKKEVKEPRKSLSEALRAQGFVKHHGSRNSPILVDSDTEGAPYVIAKRSPSPEADPQDNHIDRVLYKSASRDPKYLPPFDEFPDEVAHYLRALRRLSNKHRWDLANKGKFPEHLKPALQRAGEAAIHHDLLCIVEKDPTDSNSERYVEKAFVTALCSVLPYNKLTLGKLVLKLCYAPYWKWLQAREEEGLRQWKELLEPEIQPMIEAYEKEVAKASATDEVDMTDDGGDGGKKAELKKVPAFTQDMKDIFRQLVENTQEQVDINKKMEEWGQRIEGQSSELNMRKFLYTKIINMYPEGYMTSLALSRAFTNFKRSGQGAKLKEEQALAAQQQ